MALIVLVEGGQVKLQVEDKDNLAIQLHQFGGDSVTLSLEREDAQTISDSLAAWARGDRP